MSKMELHEEIAFIVGEEKIETIKMLLSIIEQEKRKSFDEGNRVGQYRAADKLYTDITTLYMFKNNLDNPKVGAQIVIDKLLKNSEAILNENSEQYRAHMGELRSRYKTVYMLYTVNRQQGVGHSYAFDSQEEADSHLDKLHPLLGWDWDRYILEQTYELEEDSHDCGDDE